MQKKEISDESAKKYVITYKNVGNMRLIKEMITLMFFYLIIRISKKVKS